MNAACRNFISRDVQPRAASASDIVDGSCDATGRYYTRGSLSQAFRRETKTEPGLVVLLYTIAKRSTATVNRALWKEEWCRESAECSRARSLDGFGRYSSELSIAAHPKAGPRWPQISQRPSSFAVDLQRDLFCA